MRVELIQELIPLGLAEVGRVLDEEVERSGPRHARKGEGEVIYRHGATRARYAWAGSVIRSGSLGCDLEGEASRTSHWAAGEVDEGLFRKASRGGSRGRSGCRSRRCRGSSEGVSGT